MRISPLERRNFQKKVLAYYRSHKRDLPWRHTRDPYRIWVSEVMLQQTTVERVVPYYKAWMKSFSTIQALSRASTKSVLSHWSGLGYNSRALRLRDAARMIVSKHTGRLPRDKTALVALPGIGPYTAGAIRAFAYNEKDFFLETNIRTVLIGTFFPRKREVSDQELLAVLRSVSPGKDFRTWYNALMDFGAQEKKRGLRTNRRVRGYMPQSKFAGSMREVRGALIRLLLKESLSKDDLMRKLSFSPDKIKTALGDLLDERMIVLQKGKYGLSRK